MIYKLVLLIFIFEYIRPGNLFPFLNMLKIGTLLPLTIMVVSVFTNKVSTAFVARNVNFILLAFFLFLLVLSVLFADVTAYSFTIFTTVLGYFFLYFIIVKQLYTVEHIDGLLKILIFCHVVVALLSPDVFLQPETRSYTIQGTFLGDGNDFALSLVIIFPFGVYLMQNSRQKKWKIVYALILGFVFLCIIGTQSRGATIGLFMVLSYLWAKNKRKYIGIIAALVILVTMIIYAPPEYFDRMNTLRAEEIDGSAMGRLIAWKAAVQMAIDNPLLGVGTGHFPVKFGMEYMPRNIPPNSMPWLNSHSIYFQILGELGFPGILFLMGFLAYNFFNNSSNIRRLKYIKSEEAESFKKMMISFNASLIGFAFAGAFLTAIYYPHLYVIGGIYAVGDSLVTNYLEKDSPAFSA